MCISAPALTFSLKVNAQVVCLSWLNEAKSQSVLSL